MMLIERKRFVSKKRSTKKITKKQQELRRKAWIEFSSAFLFVLILLSFFGEFGLTLVVGDVLVLVFKFLFGMVRFFLYAYFSYLLYKIFKTKKLFEMNSRFWGTLLVLLSVLVFFSIVPFYNLEGVDIIVGEFLDNIAIDSSDALSGGGIIGVSFYAVLKTYTGIAGTVTITLFVFLIGLALCLRKTLYELVGAPIASTTTTISDSIDTYRERKKQEAFDVEAFYDDEMPEMNEIDLDEEDALAVEPFYEDEQEDYYKNYTDDLYVKPEENEDTIYDYDNVAFNGDNSFPEDMPLPEDMPVFDGESYTQNQPIDAIYMTGMTDVTNITDEAYVGEPIIEKEEKILPKPVVKKTKSYRLPNIAFLDKSLSGVKQNVDRATQRQQLQMALESFGVDAQVTNVHVGPAVTQYEITLAPGVKVNRIVNLQTDLALALAAKGVRIEAPIPGKAAVGIEVPNESVQMVGLYDVLRPVHQDKSKKLLVGLGKKISGEAMQIELNKMPHLLVAGSTGSGKSVCINSIVTSILLRATPEEVKFLMVDPKKVELNVYNDIPHLLSPVVTDPKKAAAALQKVVRIMEERYELFADNFVRNMEAYNDFARANEKEELPYIVVIIDELADLMVVASKEVEEAIMRLAQMARAAGIHMIVATQRPSVDVITGVIKSNIPSRIAFAVSSQVDSRTILDMGGAERLVGKGDMLYLDATENKPVRVQGAYVSETEIEKIVDFVKDEQEVEFDESLTAETLDVSAEELFSDDAVDELFEEAVAFAISVEMISASKLQRRFRLGYNRAARIIDEMVDRNLLGPSAGNKGRPVLIRDISEINGKNDLRAEDIYPREED